MHVNDQIEPTMFAIFDGTGDLAWRKLVPALFDLCRDRSLPPHFSINVLGRGKVADDNPLQYEVKGHGGCGSATKEGK